jgi:2,4-dienoyl-CoA reductase-like NADH-dependent reductase (Old Yellow Enzyme family)
MGESQLFQPLTIRGVTIKNRIAVSPMCQYSSADGFANDWHLVHLGTRAVGGAGLVFTEAAAVSPEGRISPDDLGIWKDEHIDMLQHITEFITAHGAVPGIQLAHAGRKASHASPWNGNGPLHENERGWETVAPTALPYKEGDLTPKEMTTAEIKQLVVDFAEATKRAASAGFKIVEIHAAHGYLINEFLSPLSNHRTDEYGGSFDNRVRVLLDIVQAVQKVWKNELPLFVRLSVTEWADGGFSPEDSVELTKRLIDLGVDLIDCSSGGNAHHQKIPVGPMYQVPLAAKIKKESGLLTGAVGLITSAQQAEQILQRGEADLIFLARQLLRDPYFPLHAAKELGVNVDWPKQYDRAKIK